MLNLYSSTYYFKCILVVSFSIINLTDITYGAAIDANARKKQNQESLQDMKVISNQEAPEFSRKDLMEIIHKSQFFQDIFSDQPDPMMIQFGHVCENPNEWEQRFEQRDFNKNQYQGKIRWGNKNGDYGEHYWDLGHAG